MITASQRVGGMSIVADSRRLTCEDGREKGFPVRGCRLPGLQKWLQSVVSTSMASCGRGEQMWWTGIRDRVEMVGTYPGSGGMFGATFGHGWLLDPPLSADDVEELEGWLGMTLPDDYRSFLIEVAAGGAGPFYGIFPVHGDGGGGWEWDGDGGEMIRRDLLAESFPTDRLTADERLARTGPEPMRDTFATDAEYDDALDVWHDRDDDILLGDERTAGAICLADEGCAIRWWLVVSGPALGTIWRDPRTEGDDLYAIPGPDPDSGLTFQQWYMAWLDEAEQLLTPDTLGRR